MEKEVLIGDKKFNVKEMKYKDFYLIGKDKNNFYIFRFELLITSSTQ
jgi:hypothetical protein